MRTRSIVIGLTAVTILAVSAIVFIPPLLKPEKVSTPTYWPTQGWRTSTPEEQGFDSGKLAEELQAIQKSNIKIDSLLIIRNGYVILDAYFYPYDNSIPHKLASVTKSFTTTLIGIAVDQGKIRLDQSMVSFFPDRTIANLDARKQRITVQYLASMKNGFESGCLAGDEPTLDEMRSNLDWVQAALDRKMVQEPGAGFCYDSPGMHLLSAILQKATGMTELEFARQNLFEPLGIREVFWQSDPQGYTHGWGDLFLKPREAAKIGYLWLNKGVWDGRQVVSAAWVADSVKVHGNAGQDNYGYGWWISRDPAPSDSYFALGRGGQNVRVYPSYNAIVVMTASDVDYDQIDRLLRASFIEPNKPLPSNTAGVAELEATLTALAQAPHPWQVGPLPDIARAISGKTYVFRPNAIDVATMRFEFDGDAQATLYMNLQGRDVIWPIGLDGKYRVEPDGRALRGYWAGQQTFVFELFEDGLSTFHAHFSDDRVELSSPERGMQLEGQAQNP